MSEHPYPLALLNVQLPGPSLSRFWFPRAADHLACELAFLTSPPARQQQLVQDPYFENHWSLLVTDL